MISLGWLVSLVVYLLVAGLVIGLCLWLIDYLSGQFPTFTPFAKAAKVVVVVFAVLLLIALLLNLAGGPVPVFRP